MEARSGFDIVISSGPIASAAVDLLAFTTFGDPSKDATFKAFDAQLKGALSDIAKTELFEGKPGQVISLYTADRLPARRLLVVGAGPRNEFTNPQLRDLAATVAQTANKVGASTAGLLLPALGDAREASAVQLAAEGL